MITPLIGIPGYLCHADLIQTQPLVSHHVASRYRQNGQQEGESTTQSCGEKFKYLSRKPENLISKLWGQDSRAPPQSLLRVPGVACKVDFAGFHSYRVVSDLSHYIHMRQRDLNQNINRGRGIGLRQLKTCKMCTGNLCQKWCFKPRSCVCLDFGHSRYNLAAQGSGGQQWKFWEKLAAPRTKWAPQCLGILMIWWLRPMGFYPSWPLIIEFIWFNYIN